MRILPLLAGLSLASAAQAGPITYGQALAAANRQAPALRAASLQLEAATAAAAAAGRLPDPKLGVGLDNAPISGPMAGRLSADEMTMARIGLSQDVPSAAKRRAQRGQAQADIAAASAEAGLTAQQVRLETAGAWIELLYAQRKLAALDEILSRLEPVWQAAPSAVASGRARSAQALEARQAQAAFLDRRSGAEADLVRAQAQMRRWTGEPDPVAQGDAPGHDVDPAALRATLAQAPRLKVLEASASQARAELALAKADKVPDWSWDVAYQRRDSLFGDMISAGVSISLPLWGKTRQGPMIDARAASASRAAAQREDAERALVAELEAGLADHRMHHDQWLRARDVIAPLAKERAQLETAAYSAGAASLVDVATAFSGLADAQLTLIEREAAVAADSARLRLTYGDTAQ